MLIKYLFKEVYNSIDYPLRQFFKWKRKNLIIKNEPKLGIFDNLSPEDKLKALTEEKRILKTYNLSNFYNNSTIKYYLINLYYIQLLESAFNSINELAIDLKIADIGVSDWFYVQALYSFFKWYRAPKGRNIHLEGYEIDAYRVYYNLYSRYDYAMNNIKNLSNVIYIPDKFKIKTNYYDVITMFFPFILIKDHLKWGLPGYLFNPKNLLLDVIYSLKNNSFLIIVNQGKEEYEIQKELIKELNLFIVKTFCIYTSLFYKYKHLHFVTVCKK